MRQTASGTKRAPEPPAEGKTGMGTLLVVDGNSIVNRAFFGIRGLSNSKGMPTNAVYGFINIIDRYRRRYSPDAVVVAFDLHAPTFRHKMFDGYKAKRRPMPDELRVQMPYARRAALALGCEVVEREGFEADDVLGTYARLGKEAGMKVILLTGDRDSLQLINGSVSVLLASTGDSPLVDERAFFERYGVTPDRFVDVKAIMGDQSDNIPGIPGIGEKGAFSLISEFGSLDAVIEAASAADAKIKPGTRDKILAGRDSAIMSRELATIVTNVDVPPVSELREPDIDPAEAYALFTELEFSEFMRKFGLTKRIPGYVSRTPETGDVRQALTPGAAFYIEEGRIYISSAEGDCFAPLTKENLEAIAHAAKDLSTHDAKSASREAEKFGVDLRGIGYDVMLAAYVVNPQRKTGLSELSDDEGLSREDPPSRRVLALRDRLDAELEKCGGKIFREIEMPLSDVLADMEKTGFLIDTEGLREYGVKLNELVEGLKYRIYAAAGIEFNINSPKQLGDILFERMGLPHGKKKSSGYSTEADILEKLAPDYPVVDDILEYRKYMKLIGTYVNGLIAAADRDGVVHTSFRQTGTATGRLSSAEPNLQNIPVRTPEGRELRRFFKARPGHLLIDADYSQIELRLLAAISGDERMLAAFAGGEDIHTATASAVFGVPKEAVTTELRKRAKAVNFGIVYGIGEYSLSDDLGISIAAAKRYISGYLDTYPGVRDYLSSAVESAKKLGYTDTLFGRRRYIPELSSPNGTLRKFGERVAMNSPIQGTAADIIKIAMIKTSDALAASGIDAKLIMQVHDELIIDAAAADAGKAAAILKDSMENAVDLPVKLTVEVTSGERWEK